MKHNNSFISNWNDINNNNNNNNSNNQNSVLTIIVLDFFPIEVMFAASGGRSSRISAVRFWGPWRLFEGSAYNCFCAHFPVLIRGRHLIEDGALTSMKLNVYSHPRRIAM